MNALIDSALTISTLIALVGCALCLAKGRRLVWIVVALAFYLTNDLALTLPKATFGLHTGHWNWVGKAIAVLTSASWLAALRLPTKEVGLALPKHAEIWCASLVGIAILIAIDAGVCAFYPTSAFNLEDIAFQATMPGLDEELAYRGILLALLIRGFSHDIPDQRSIVLAGVVVTIQFGLMHIVRVQGWHVGFKIEVESVFPTIAGCIFLWLRLRTQSVLVPILEHNMVNVSDTLVGSII